MELEFSLQQPSPAKLVVAVLLVGFVAAIPVNPLFIIAIPLGLAFVLIAFSKPSWILWTWGASLFVQEAVGNLPSLPEVVAEQLVWVDELFLLVLGTVVIVSCLVKGGTLKVTTCALPAVGFAVIGFFSGAWNSGFGNLDALSATAIGTLHMLRGYLVLLVVANCRVSPAQIRKGMLAFFALFVLVELVGILQLFGISLPWGTAQVRFGGLAFAATSVFGHHTHFGNAMVVAASISAGYLAVPSLAKKPRRHLSMLFFLIGILTATTRRGLILVPLATLAVVFLLNPKKLRTRHLRALLSLTIAVLLIALIGFSVIVDMLRDIEEEYIIEIEEQSRYLLYQASFKILSRNPLLGAGPGSFGSHTSVLFSSSLASDLGLNLSDNLMMGAPFAKLWGEFGLLGFAAFMWFLWRASRLLVRSFKRFEGFPQMQSLAAGILIALITLTLSMLVNPAINGSFAAYFVFGGMGTLVSASVSEKRACRELD